MQTTLWRGSSRIYQFKCLKWVRFSVKHKTYLCNCNKSCFPPVLGMSTDVCLCLCAHRGRMTPGSPAVNHTDVTRSRWPIKNLGQTPNHSCALRVFSSTLCHCFFTDLFPFPFSPSRRATGVFFCTHMHTHAHIPKKTHARTHTRTQYTLLLFINLQGVNWNPPWVSAVPAFPLSLSVKVPLGGNRGGGWWRKESSTVSPVTGQLNIHRSHWIKLCSQLVSASLNGEKKRKMPGAKYVNPWVLCVRCVPGSLAVASLSHQTLIPTCMWSGAWNLLNCAIIRKRIHLEH